MRHCAILLSTLVATTLLASGTAAARNKEKIAVLITDWAEPQGIDPLYRREVINRSFGASAATADVPCTEDFVGAPPFRQQLGLIPYTLGFKTRGLEGAFDSMGLYRRSADGV